MRREELAEKYEHLNRVRGEIVLKEAIVRTARTALCDLRAEEVDVLDSIYDLEHRDPKETL